MEYRDSNMPTSTTSLNYTTPVTSIFFSFFFFQFWDRVLPHYPGWLQTWSLNCPQTPSSWNFRPEILDVVKEAQCHIIPSWKRKLGAGMITQSVKFVTQIGSTEFNNQQPHFTPRVVLHTCHTKWWGGRDRYITRTHCQIYKLQASGRLSQKTGWVAIATEEGHSRLVSGFHTCASSHT